MVLDRQNTILKRIGGGLGSDMIVTYGLRIVDHGQSGCIVKYGKVCKSTY